MIKTLYRSILVMLISTSAITGRSGELKINGYKVKDFPLIENKNGWSFNYKQNFNQKNEDVWRQLQLKSSGWKKHPKYPGVCGYNGDITLKIIGPGPISELKAAAKIINYTDRKTRKAQILWSIDGINFHNFAEKEFGAATLNGTVKPAVNQGIIWLRFCRMLESEDVNGKYGYVVFKSIDFNLSGNKASEKKQNDKQLKSSLSYNYDLKKNFPTGVFWPWERTKPNADFAGKELWAFVEDTMKTLKENNCDTLWFVNIGPSSKTRKICQLAAKYKLKVLINTDLLSYYYNGFDSMDNMESRARKTINTIGDCQSLIGYVLKDEPLLCNLSHCNYFYDLMKRLDPKKRDSVVVAMNRQTQSFLEDSKLPVICSDIYYFGHDKSINIPNPAEKSQNLFRLNVAGMNKIAAQRNKHSWLMAQMFGEVWGRYYRDGDRIVVEPGSYLHWRMPTDAETRWQIWEAMRCGSKGILFYVLYPPVPLYTPPEKVKPRSPEAKKVARMDKLAKTAAGWKKQELTKECVKIDSGEGMLQPGGQPTPQMLTAGKAFKIIRKYSTLLNSRERSDFPVFLPVDPVVKASTFQVPDKYNLRYGVIVNDDLNKSRKFKVLLPLNIKTVKNLNNGKTLEIKKEDSAFKSCELELDAGDGCLLKSTFIKDQPGMPLLKENFAQLSKHKVKVNKKNAKIERFGAFYNEPFYRIKMIANKNEPVFTIENLTNRKSAANTVFMNINNSKKQGKIYCLVKGNLKNATIKAVNDPQADGQKTNVMHLNEKLSNSDDKSISVYSHVIKKEKFHIPAVVPAGTTSLQFFLGPNDSIEDVVIWFVSEMN